MKKIIYLVVFVSCFLISVTRGFSQQPDPKYFNQSLPETTPKVFAPGNVSTKEEFEFGAIFSSDRTEFYYAVFLNGRAETRMMKFDKGKWSAPVKILFHDVYSYNDPFLTPDNKKLYFISDRAMDGLGPKKDYDIWYVEREAGKWSEPKNAGRSINSDKNEYYMSFTKAGTIYFSSNVNGTTEKENYDIFSSEMKNGSFAGATRLDSAVNTKSYEADVFVAPDESYVVFAANRPGGLGNGDLYVSFRRKDGTWTTSKSLGNSINTDTDDFCPYVTPDGKYLFYASRGDVYWVLLTSLRDFVRLILRQEL